MCACVRREDSKLLAFLIVDLCSFVTTRGVATSFETRPQRFLRTHFHIAYYTMSQRSHVADALYFDFDLTLSNTSIDAAVADVDDDTNTGESKENCLTVEECRAVFQTAARSQDGSVSFKEYCDRAQQFLFQMDTRGVAVVMLSNNNKTNIVNGMEAMGIHFSGDILSLHEQRRENPDATKWTALYQHGVEHGYTTAVFVDDSAKQCASVLAEFAEEKEKKKMDIQIKIKVVQVPQPKKRTKEKGGLFNFLDAVREVEEALVVE